MLEESNSLCSCNKKEKKIFMVLLLLIKQFGKASFFFWLSDGLSEAS